MTDMHLYCAMDVVADRAATFAKKYGAKRISTDYGTLLRDPELTSISLAVPHDLHAPMALQAVEAGKHVLVEKPFTLDADMGRQVLAAAATRNVVVMPVSQHRFDPLIQVMRELIRGGHLGRIVLVRGHLECLRDVRYYVESNWRGTLAREGGSVLVNQAYHVLDLMICLAGKVARASAEMDALALKGAIDTEDTLAACLRFASGAMGVLSVSGASGREWAPSFELTGTAGMVAFDLEPARVRQLQLRDDSKRAAYQKLLEEAVGAASDSGAALSYYGASHRQQMRAFAGLLSGVQCEDALTGDEAIEVVEAIQAVYRSAGARTPVGAAAPERMVGAEGSELDVRPDVVETHPVRQNHWQNVREEDIEAVARILRAGVLNNEAGGLLEKLEREFAAFACSGHGVAFCNGTGALHAALFALGVQRGDDVLVCDYSFHGAATAALRLGARLVPVDCREDTLAMDPADVERAMTARTKALLVHNPWGVPADFEALRKVARGVPIVSDASHAHGATYRGKALGHWADITCFSLGWDKLITGGELGMAVTDSDRHRDAMLTYGHINRVPRGLIHKDIWNGNAVGLKLRPHVVALALARAQLGRYPHKRALTDLTCRRLEWSLAELGLVPQATTPEAERVYYRLVFRLDERMHGCDAGQAVKAFCAAGVKAGTSDYLPPLQHHALLRWPDYASQILHRECPTATRVASETIHLEAPVVLSEKHLSKRLAKVAHVLERLRRLSAADALVGQGGQV
jgi:dTDP-4-amino-4,6-dideoxygalactose transaminase/predicted dehydrogenase